MNLLFRAVEMFDVPLGELEELGGVSCGAGLLRGCDSDGGCCTCVFGEGEL